MKEPVHTWSAGRLNLRRLAEIALLVAFVVIGVLIIWWGNPFGSSSDQEGLTEARYWVGLEGKRVQCQLCFRKCVIAEGQRGYCTNRINKKGKLFTLVYNKPLAIDVDPVEKEPLFHFLPGSSTLCFGTAGCNFRCSFCQNWHLATRTLEETSSRPYTVERAVDEALEQKCTSISFTYNEPTVFYEWMYDVARLAKKKGLRTYFHTNGAMSEAPLQELLKHMDAVSVDLKAFTVEFYRETSFSDLQPVLTTLKVIKESGVWFEVVNLVIPTMNDDLEKIREMCIWVRDNLGKDVPLHFNRFFPSYKIRMLPPTPIETLEAARAIALEVGLKYVFIGNYVHEANSTFCPRCGGTLVKRVHINFHANNIKDGRCPFCGHEVPGVWR